jgi:peptide/nickel transport system substrate-binding protein
MLQPTVHYRFLLRVVLVIMLLMLIAPLSIAQGGFGEAPMLAERVAAGGLPPVEERLPANPAVVQNLGGEPGEYGGTLRVGFVGNNPGWGGMWYINGWDNLVIWKPDFSGVDPNIAERWEISDDVREYTFYLREGIRWSDGEPFTADDIVFYVEDILFNAELSPAGPVADWLPRDGAADFRIEKIDDHTVKLIFANPYGTFLYDIATWSGRHLTFFPKHYLTQFHASYNENVDELVVAEEGVDNWVGLFNKKAAGPTDDIQNFFNMPERPLLYPFVITQPLGTGTTILLERNPYYWKVDPQGRQLPYIDNIVGTSYQDNEARTLAMLNGDLDYVKDPGDDNRIIYFDAVEAGQPLRINAAISDGGVTNTIHFNRTVDNPVKAEVFANKDFRIGMSHAINRQEIIDIVHFGQTVPAQASPLESSPLYNERLTNQYLEFDRDLANDYLDRVLPERDGDGFRLGSDGNRLSIVFSVSNNLSYGTNWVQIAELLIEHWRAVGVEVILNSMPDTQFIDNKKDNNLELTIYTGEGGAGVNAILDPRYFVPGGYFSMYGNGWHAWFVNSTDSVQVEPPQEIKDFRAAYEEVLAQPTQEQQIAKMREVLEMAADEFWTIGIARPVPGYQPYHARLGGMPDSWIAGWIPGVQKLKYPEQWFIRQ